MKPLDESNIGNPQIPAFKPSLNYSLILGLLSIIIIAGVHYAKIDETSWASVISHWLIMIGAIYFILNHFKTKINSGYLTIGQGVKVSVLTGLFTGIIAGICTYFLVTMIAPEIIDMAREKMLSAMEEQQNVSDSQMKQTLEIAEMFLAPGAISAIVALKGLICYTIIGLIISAIIKRD
jgi:Protein of unknown function (DUF4199)